MAARARMAPHRARTLIDGLGALAFLLAKLIQAKIDHDPRHPRRETGFPLELHQALPPLNPCFLRKFNGLVLIPHHGVGPRVNLVPMPGYQLLEGDHVAPSRGPNQGVV